jgi:SOS-response transcriptional repressor LexA
MQATTNPQRVLSALQDYWATYRAMPSFGAVAKEVGLSVSTVADGVSKLKAAAFLKSGPTGRLQPGQRFFERQLLGRVQAGLPAEAGDIQPEGMVIDEYLVDTPAQTVLLTIKGESMRDVGLLPGDVVVVRRELHPNVGDIVVAMVDGDEMTVKQLAQDAGGTLYLQARNPDYPDIRPREQMRFIGIVIGQFRRYARTFRPLRT